MNSVSDYRQQLSGKGAQAVIEWWFKNFASDTTVFASSLGAEDQLLTHMLLTINPEVRIITIDTGRLPQETYDTMQATMEKYHFQYEVLFPDFAEVERINSSFGPNLFYAGIEQRKMCCDIRKVKPLKRALAGCNAWITGLRRQQSVTRKDLHVIEWDTAFYIYKLNPLVELSQQDVWDYITKHDVPYNRLHDLGYPSIGCAPCTRAVSPGADLRSGRWWWELPDKKECGLHPKSSMISA